MILIISSIKDYTTNRVIQWLLHFNQKFVRVNDFEPIEVLRINIDNNGLDFIIKIKNKVIAFSEVKSFWYRRGIINLKQLVKFSNKCKLNNLEIKNYLQEEIEQVYELICDAFYSKPHINGVRHHHLNKLKVLLTASKLGINIPYTVITTSDKNLKNQKSLITKSIKNCAYFSDSAGTHYMTTELYSTKNRNNYFPTLFQQKIEKQYEVRTFYLNGKMFSMAIFSQSNKRTSIDYRNYDTKNPNRTVPYNLNADIRRKINSLMKKLELNSGSLDLIKARDGKYFFLEVNPVGQFGSLSHLCNYNLEKLIATTLSHG